MSISFNKDEFRTLIKLAYLGEWVSAVHLGEHENPAQDQLLQKIYSQAKAMGCEDLVEFDSDTDRYEPGAELEADEELRAVIEDYEDSAFWELLISRLAMRDAMKDVGEDELEGEAMEQFLESLEQTENSYSEEFENHGLDRLKIQG